MKWNHTIQGISHKTGNLLPLNLSLKPSQFQSVVTLVKD